MEAAWHSDGQALRLTSDFRFVEDFFVKRRKKEKYTAPEGTIRNC